MTEPTSRGVVRRDGSAGSPPAPPFEPGNQLARKHGAYSPAAIAEKAEEVHEKLLEVAPWCAEERYIVSVDRYLKAAAREALAHEALMASEKLSPRLMETATAASRLAWMMGAELGLTPAGHLRLRELLANTTEAEASVADLSAKGREVREAAEARLAAAEAIDAEAEEDADQ